MLLAREELVVFSELFTVSILAAKEEESVVTTPYKLCTDAADDAEFCDTVVLRAFRLEENEAELAVICAASDADVLLIDD